MINFRYHIVSITAVFLALGIGLAMGSAFLADAAVDQLRDNVSEAETDIREVRRENGELNDQVDQLNDIDTALQEAGGDLFRDRLGGVPVLLIAPADADQDSLNALADALSRSDAEFDGTLLFTDKLRLDGDEAEELSGLLGTASAEPEPLGRIFASRLSQVLLEAAEVPDDGTEPPGGTAPSDPSTTEPVPPQPVLLTELIDAGFLEFIPAPGAPAEAAVLDDTGFRYVMVGDPAGTAPAGPRVLPVVREMAVDGPAPLVLATAATGRDPEATRTAVVGPVREDGSLADRVSTVDDLEHFAGTVATILALEELSGTGRSHFGVGDGAEAVLPAPPGQS
jgi:hypothetical protein